MAQTKQNTGLVIVVVGAVISIAVLFVYFSKDKGNLDAADMAGHHNSYSAPANSGQLNNLLNKSVPDFSLTDMEGNVYSSENLKGKRVVLFFNEGLMCYPACWNQIAALGKDERLNKDDTVALSVVVDSKNDWEKAIKQMPELSKAKVLFDKGAAVSRIFGVLNLPSSMHPGSLPGHTYVVFDKEGTVRFVFDDPNMGIRNDQLISEISKL